MKTKTWTIGADKLLTRLYWTEENPDYVEVTTDRAVSQLSEAEYDEQTKLIERTIPHMLGGSWVASDEMQINQEGSQTSGYRRNIEQN